MFPHFIDRSLGNFVAVMMQASRVFADVDASFASKCRQASDSAWTWPIVDRIVERTESLAKFSSRGRTPPELRSIGDHTWREIQESPWRLIYRVSAGVVQVHAVLDGRRSLEDILMERILRG